MVLIVCILTLGPLVSTVMTRCIHCTRCVRFAEEVAGVYELGTTGRGTGTEIGTYVDKMMTSELSGNLVDLCPVGALTNAPYAFTTRPWEIKSINSVDLIDSLCPNVIFDKRGNEIMRSLPRVNEEVNEEWLSDKSRYSYDGLKRQRLEVPLRRNPESGGFDEMNWDDALLEIANRMKSLKDPSSQLLGLVGEFSSLETLSAMRDLFSKLDNRNLSFSLYGETPVTSRSDYLLNAKVSEIGESDVVLLVGCNLKYESPLLNSRLYKGTRRLKNKTKVYTLGSDFDLGYKTVHLGNNLDLVNQILSGEHPFAEKLKRAKKAHLIVSSRLADSLREYSALNHNLKVLVEKTNQETGEERVFHGILQNYVGHINAQELGIQNLAIGLNAETVTKSKIIYNMGNDNSRLISKLSRTLETGKISFSIDIMFNFMKSFLDQLM